jgi:hypothetical protein
MDEDNWLSFALFLRMRIPLTSADFDSIVSPLAVSGSSG